MYFAKGFDDNLVGNDEKVAFSKKHAQYKTRVKKTYTIYDQNDWKTIPFGDTYLYSPYRVVALPGGLGRCSYPYFHKFLQS